MSRIVIAGCGFVGLAAARLFQAAGWDVLGLTHSAASAEALRDEAFAVQAMDLGVREGLAALADWRGCEAVIHCASSGRGGVDAYRRVYLQGARHLAESLQPGQIVFTSSTSVYAQTSGEWVTETSPAEPDRETGRVLLETEAFVCTQGGCAARLAGIYGPGRSVLLRKFFNGEAVLEGDGTRWVNQVHRDDIATALLRLVETGARGIVNINDDTPMTQRAVYEGLAAQLQRPLPPSGPIDPNRKRGWTSKRVSNAKLRALGWAPRYASFFEALTNDPQLLAAATSPADESGDARP